MIVVQNPHLYPVDVIDGPALSTAESAEVADSVDVRQQIALGQLVLVEGAKASKSKDKK